MTKIEFGKPIKVFYANLLAIGVELSVDKTTSKLRVEGNLDALSPVYRQEIIKRARPLIDLLTPSPPSELASYFGRLLHLHELKEAFFLAEMLAASVDVLPVNGGWLLTLCKESD